MALTTHDAPAVDDRSRPERPAPRPDRVRGSERRDNWLFLTIILSGMALITAVFGVGLGVRAIDDAKAPASGESSSASAPAVGTLHLTEFEISPATLTVAAGGSLRLMNMGTTAHNVKVKGTDVASPMVEPGGTVDLGLGSLPAGDYTVFCEVPGHEAAGMTAKLTVVKGVGAASLAPAGAASATMTVDQMDEMMNRAIKAFPAKTQGEGALRLAPTVLAGGVKQFELTTSIVKWEVEPGRFVDAWTYNGTVPGPTIAVDPGDKVQVVVHNQLPESTAVHFHGLITPNSQDGVPGITQDVIKPGQTFTYSFTAQSTPAVGMYHSHQDAAKQVPNGLAGAFLVGHEPVPTGVTVAQEQIMMLNDSGTIGLTLNGKSFPATAPVVAKLGDWVEVQYMNEGQMVHPMHLHGMAQLVIAKDGFPVPAPYQVDTLLVAPGERYTVLIHADNLGVWAWHCHILNHAEREDGMFGMVTAMVVTA